MVTEGDTPKRDAPFDAVAAKKRGEEAARKLWPTVQKLRGVDNLLNPNATTPEGGEEEKKDKPE